MQINKKFKIEKCVSTDEERQKLMYVSIEKKAGKGRAVATDGSVLAVVPVALRDDDVPGPITPESLKASRKKTLGQENALMFLRENAVLCEDTTEYPRSFESHTDEQGDLFRVEPDEDFPNVDGVVPIYEDSFSIGLSVKRLKQIADALGDDGVIIQCGRTHGKTIEACAITVRPINEEARTSGAFGILMPMVSK